MTNAFYLRSYIFPQEFVGGEVTVIGGKVKGNVWVDREGLVRAGWILRAVKCCKFMLY